jgi:hypothetical protein
VTVSAAVSAAVSVAHPRVVHMFEERLAATTRRPSPRTVAAVLVRDLTCVFPGCRVPAFRCDLDHVVAPRPGGPPGDARGTEPGDGPGDGPDDDADHGDHDDHDDAGNLVALCRHHRVVRARDGWRPALLRDGTVRWTAPSGHTFLRAAVRRA